MKSKWVTCQNEVSDEDKGEEDGLCFSSLEGKVVSQEECSCEVGYPAEHFGVAVVRESDEFGVIEDDDKELVAATGLHLVLLEGEKSADECRGNDEEGEELVVGSSAVEALGADPVELEELVEMFEPEFGFVTANG